MSRILEPDWENRNFDSNHRKTKIKQAIAEQDAFKNMAQCLSGGESCGSVFCPNCKEEKAEALNSAYLRYFRNEFEWNEAKARTQLRYGTILHEIVPVTETPLLGLDGTIEDVKASVDRFKKNLLAVNRKLREGFWFGGGIGTLKANVFLLGTLHLELIDLDLYRNIYKSGDKPCQHQDWRLPIHGETDKQRTFREWFGKAGIATEHRYYFVVHGHFLVDNDGLKNDELETVFRSIRGWNFTRRQVEVKRFTTQFGNGDRHKLTDAFENISNYGYNGSNAGLRFTTTYGDSKGVYVCKEERDALYRLNVVAHKEEKNAVDKDLSVGQLRLLIKAHNAFTDDGGNGLLVMVKRTSNLTTNRPKSPGFLRV